MYNTAFFHSSMSVIGTKVESALMIDVRWCVDDYYTEPAYSFSLAASHLCKANV